MSEKQHTRRRLRSLPLLLVAAGVVLVALLVARSASEGEAAATIAVDTIADEKPGVTPPNGNCSLREALRSAADDLSSDGCAAGSGADTVSIPGGNYVLAASFGPVEIQDSAVSLVGVGSSTVIDGGGSHGVIYAVGSPPMRLQDLTVRGGGHSSTAIGAGIANFGNLTLHGVTVTENDIGGGLGGGIYNGGAGDLTVSDSTVASNAGSGIHDEGHSLTLVEANVFDNTQASGGDEGGLETHHATISDSSFSSNDGNGIYALGPIDVADTQIISNEGGISLLPGAVVSSSLDGVRITGNGGPGLAGGGISNLAGPAGGSNLEITDSLIENNIAGGGGAINNDPGNGTLTVERTLMVGNRATVGGGGAVSNFGRLVIANSTLAANDAFENGGAIVNYGGEVTIRSATIAENTSTEGTGGLQGGGSFNLGNTIVADNLGAPGAGDDCFTPITSAGFNLVERFDPGQCAISGDSTGNVYATDPDLGGLQDNGGPSQTYGLPIDSPAVDGGSGFGRASDQRGSGFPRTIDYTAIGNAQEGDGTDIGAFELQPSPPNGPPVLLAIGDRSAQAGQLLTIIPSATDPEGLPLTYAASGLPQGASFDPVTHRLDWTPGASQVGRHAGIRLEVSDGILSDSERIAVTVAGAPPVVEDRLGAAIARCKRKYKGKKRAKQRKRCIKKAKRQYP